MQNMANAGQPAADVRTPSATAMHAAESAGRRAKKDAPVRHRFFQRDQVGEPDPPLARVLRGARGGRGGDVRLRLYLSMLWLVRDDSTLSYPARSWAALLGLDEPETKGARRIKDALVWLSENRFVDMRRLAGHDSQIQLLDDAGSGQRYELPGAAYNRLRAQSAEAKAKAHLYTRMPAALWTNGWLSLLSGSAIGMLLILMYESQRAQMPTVWISPSLADLRYGLSEDTRSKGVLQLEQAGLVHTHRRAVAPDAFDYRKFRNVYELRTEVLMQGPASLHLNLSRAELRHRGVKDLIADNDPFGRPPFSAPS